MQLDRTRIAIRERGLLETIDLALVVVREFLGPLVACALLAIVPLALINYALVGWMAPAEFDDESLGFRYLWNMTLLIFLEAPLASVFIVAYLGPAVFLEQRTIRQVAADVLRQALPLLLAQGLLRGVLVAWVLYLLTDRLEANGWIEGFLMIVLVLWSSALRAFRPYINEIILLERNPLLARRGAAITVGKRSSHLHGPYSGDLFIRWCGAAIIGAMLAVLVTYTAVMAQGVLVTDWPFHFSMEEGGAFAWNLDWFKLQVVYPACLWLVAAFLAVVRFLSYLDLRIRHEGWEVELLMRAEALRLAMQVE
jgi:hypothetical protein